MQEKHLFEYAVIRIVPRVEREEFVNTGIILFCKNLRFLHVLYELNANRLQMLCAHCEAAEIETHLAAFAAIAAGDEGKSPIAGLDVAGRFRWLTAQRSTVLQTGKVHPGFCNDPMEKAKQLFRELVL